MEPTFDRQSLLFFGVEHLLDDLDDASDSDDCGAIAEEPGILLVPSIFCFFLFFGGLKGAG